MDIHGSRGGERQETGERQRAVRTGEYTRIAGTGLWYQADPLHDILVLVPVVLIRGTKRNEPSVAVATKLG
jgi:hypothetical protein